MPDAVIVGSGPNGLAAAIALQDAGKEVLVLERADTPGGGVRTLELTEPGFLHDACSAVHPLAVDSPAWRGVPLHALGVEWVHADVPLAHPFDDGTAVVLARDVHETAGALGEDLRAYRDLFAPLVEGWPGIEADVLGPLRVPRHPFATARFGAHAARSAEGLARGFRTREARALLAGCAAHSMLPLERSPSAAFALVLMTLGHRVGWPFPRGGAGRLSDALVRHVTARGGAVRTGKRVDALADVPAAPAVLLDLTPRELLRVAGDRFPRAYRAALARYRWGPGAFKVDWALDAPIPWAADACARAATVHLGGSFEEVAAAERAPWNGRVAERPFVILSEPTRFDRSRAPPGKHVAWAYCHVPNGWPGDATAAIQDQVERFAPGFKELILGRSVKGPVALEAWNPNYAGGDINGGAQVWSQLVTRPVPRLDPYATPLDGVFVCSSATPPGGGVHGLCGMHAARSALGKAFGEKVG